MQQRIHHNVFGNLFLVPLLTFETILFKTKIWILDFEQQITKLHFFQIINSCICWQGSTTANNCNAYATYYFNTSSICGKKWANDNDPLHLTYSKTEIQIYFFDTKINYKYRYVYSFIKNVTNDKIYTYLCLI